MSYKTRPTGVPLKSNRILLLLFIALLSPIVVEASSPYNLQYGCVRLFHLDNATGTSGTIMVDSAGIENGSMESMEDSDIKSSFLGANFSNSAITDGLLEYMDTNYGNGDFFLQNTWTIIWSMQSACADFEIIFGASNAVADARLYCSDWETGDMLCEYGKVDGSQYQMIFEPDVCEGTPNWFAFVKNRAGSSSDSLQLYANGTSRNVKTVSANASGFANSSLNQDFFFSARSINGAANGLIDGDFDEIIICNNALTASQLFTIYDGNYTVADVIAPNINETSYTISINNLTSGTVWRTSELNVIRVRNNTPTVELNVSEAVNASISIFRFNYLNMVANNSASKGSILLSAVQSVTLPSSLALSPGLNGLCISIIDAAGNQNVSCSSGNLTIFYDTRPIINFITFNQSQYYTTDNINLTFNVSDDDFDPQNATIFWKVNGADVFNETFTNFRGNKTSILNRENFSAGANVSFVLNVNSSQSNTTQNSTIIFTMVNFNISFNGLQAERKYEYGSNVTIRIENTDPVSYCIVINGRNFTCTTGNQSLNYTIHPVYKYDFNDSRLYCNITTYPGYCSFNFSKEVDFGNVTFGFNTTIGAGLRSVHFRINNTEHDVIVGLYNGSSLTLDTFSNYTETNRTLFYTSAGVKTTNINMSVSRSMLRFANNYLTVRGIATDANPLDFVYNFTSNGSVNNCCDRSEGDFINTSNSTGKYPLFVLDDFNRIISGRWSCIGNLDTCEVTTASEQLTANSDCASTVTQETGSNRGLTLNLSRFATVQIDYALSGSCSTGGTNDAASASSTLQLGNTLGSAVELDTRSIGCSGSGDSSSYSIVRNGTLNYTGSNTYVWIDGLGGRKNFTLSGNTNFQIDSTCNCEALQTSNSASCNSKITQIRASGFTNNQVNPTVYNTSFNLTSKVIYNTSQNIVKARLTANTYEETEGTHQFFYYLSPNGLNYESVQNGQFHFFSRQGTELSVMIYGNGTLNASPFGIISLKIEITSSFPSNLTFDFAQDGVIDVNLSSIVVNNTHSYVVNISNATTVINNYLQSGNCSGFYCNVPVDIQSDSTGDLILYNMSISLQPVNISLNYSDLERGCTNANCIFLLNITAENGSSNATIKDLTIEFKGDANISVRVTTNQSTANGERNGSFLVRYSKFNLTSPVPFFDIFPQTNNSKFVQPYGQDNATRRNTSIFNFTNLASTDKIDIWIRYNQTINSCLTVYAKNTTSVDNPTTLTTSYKRLLNNLSLLETQKSFFWINLTQCPRTIYVEDPYTYFEAACGECVKTW